MHHPPSRDSLVLRPFQQSALRALAQGVSHLVVSAPTGSGKSLIYELACRHWAKRSVLVTPLQALGVQQHQRLLEQNARLGTLHAQLGLAVHARDHRGPPLVPRGDHTPSVWIVSPEMLSAPSWQSELERYHPDLWIVDEAHCVWEWGQTFRPAYRSLFQRLTTTPRARTLWLSATFPPAGMRELRSALDPQPEFQGGFALPATLRLIWEQVSDANRIERLLTWTRLLSGKNGEVPGVIFVSSRTSAQRIGRLLAAAGFRPMVYHAGLSPEIRRATETRLQQDKQSPAILVATSAFGLGMDLEQLRWGIFWDLPYGVLDLAQRIGRVGRAIHSDAPLAPTVVALWHPIQLRERNDATLSRIMSTEQCRRAAFAAAFEVPFTPIHVTTYCCDFCSRKTLLEFNRIAADRLPDGVLGEGSSAVEKTIQGSDAVPGLRSLTQPKRLRTRSISST